MVDELKEVYKRSTEVLDKIKDVFIKGILRCNKKYDKKIDNRRWILDKNDYIEITESDTPLYRLVALKKFKPNGLDRFIEPGDIGGYITEEVANMMSNEYGSSWVEEGSTVCGYVSIKGNACVINNSHIVSVHNRPICELGKIYLDDNVIIDNSTLIANINKSSINISGFTHVKKSKIKGSVKITGHPFIEESEISNERESSGKSIIIDLYKNSIIYRTYITGTVKIMTSDVFIVNSKLADTFSVLVPGVISDQYLCGSNVLNADVFSMSFKLDHQFFMDKYGGDITNAAVCFMINMYTLELGIHVCAYSNIGGRIDRFVRKHFDSVKNVTEFFEKHCDMENTACVKEFFMYYSIFDTIFQNMMKSRENMVKSSFTGKSLANAVLSDEERERFQDFIDNYVPNKQESLDEEDLDDDTNFFEEQETIEYVSDGDAKDLL